MEGLAAAAVLIAVLLGVLLVIAFDLFCLVHLLARDDRISFLSKLAWVVAIVCVSPFGGLVYLLSAVRLTPYAPRLGDGSPRRRRLPAPGGLCASVSRPSRCRGDMMAA
jgi:hypothetical protein